MTEQQIQIPAGLIAVTTWGQIRQETASCLMEMRSHAEKQGLHNVGWAMIPGGLVEKARNEAVRMMLGAFKDPQGNSQAQWLLQIDGDMTFEPTALQRLLLTAYGTCPWADILGGYCTLKGEMGLPSIDTGLGIWEAIHPGRGPIEVIRTGTAFLLCKRHVFERIPQPWFRVRQPMRILDAMAEVDNWSHTQLNGKNPFRNLPGKPWEKLEGIASADPSSNPASAPPSEVGEDSGFCDRAKKAGLRIVVDTDIEIGHLEVEVANSQRLKRFMQKNEAQWLQAVGINV